MFIRSMQIQDVDQVVAIEQQVQFHPWKRHQFVESLSHYQCTVVEIGAQVCGFCILQPVLDEANLLLMAIDPQHQGKGLGYSLLQQAMQRLGEGCVQVFLEVRQSNMAAIALYEKAGFHQIDLRRHYYPAPHGKKEHAVIMANILNEAAFNFQMN